MVEAILIEDGRPEADVGPFDVLIPLLGDAQVIGLGEATHGDATSLRWRHSVIRWLAERHNLTTVVMERDAADVAALDDYVQGHSDHLPLDHRHYPWVNEETAETIRWMRQWVMGGNDLRLAGMDVGSLRAPSELARRMSQVDTVPEPARRLVGLIRAAEEEGWEQAQTPDWWQEVSACGADVESFLPDVLQRAGLNEFEGALWTVLAKSSRMWGEHALISARDGAWPAGGHYRDRCMAENALTFVEAAAPGSRAALWAHNGHVCLDANMAGGVLRKRLGDRYQAWGCLFGEGRFVAGTALPGGGFDPHLREHDAEPPPPDSLEAYVAGFGTDHCVLTIRELPDASPLRSEMRLRQVTLSGGEDQFNLRLVPADAYDALVWFARAEPVRVIPSPESYW